jgi:hypothetical protein
MKRVRLFAGAAPAVAGLLIPAAATAATHAPAKPAKTSKSVSLAHRVAHPASIAKCVGHHHHDTENHNVFLSFWSSPHGNFTCIGTIELHPVRIGSPAAVDIINDKGVGGFCGKSIARASKSTVFFGCGRSFHRNFSVSAVTFSVAGDVANPVFKVSKS